MWYHNKARLESKDNFNVEYEDYRTKISVSIAERSHTGTYIIKAENDSGKDEATFDITVLGMYIINLHKVNKRILAINELNYKVNLCIR